jgi:hypothetical protein
VKYLIQRVTPRTNGSYCRSSVLILEAESGNIALIKFRHLNCWAHDLFGIRYEAILLTKALEEVALL